VQVLVLKGKVPARCCMSIAGPHCWRVDRESGLEFAASDEQHFASQVREALPCAGQV
jgi:hypothetical protein